MERHDEVAAFEARGHEEAREQQSVLRRLVALMTEYGGVAVAKATMNELGVDCGPVCPPLRSVALGNLERVRAALREWGLTRTEPATLV